MFLRARHVLDAKNTLKLLVEAADSGTSVQPRNQIKNQRENSWRTTFPDNDHKIQTRFQTCMAPGLSNGCEELLVLLSLSSICLTTSQRQAKPGQTTRKPKRTTRNCSQRSWCKETPELQPKQKRWMERKSGKCTGSRLYSFTLRRSGFQKPSSASLSSLLYPPDHWTKIPAGLHTVAVLMGRVGYGQCTSTSCTRQGRHGKHHSGTTSRSYMEDLGAQNCWGNAHRAVWSHWRSNQQRTLTNCRRYLSGHWMVNCAKLEFHPSIKQHHVLQIIFFSDQDGSCDCLKCICRVASVVQPPWV